MKIKLLCKGCLYIVEHQKSRISNRWLCVRCCKPYTPERNASIHK